MCLTGGTRGVIIFLLTAAGTAYQLVFYIEQHIYSSKTEGKILISLFSGKRVLRFIVEILLW